MQNLLRTFFNVLKRKYASKNATRIYQLKHELQAIQQGIMSVTEYFNALQGNWDELAKYSSASTGVYNNYGEVHDEKEEEKIYQFLMGLNTLPFGIIRSQILITEPLPSLDNILGSSLQEESHLAISATQENLPEVAAALTAVQRQKRRGRIICAYCGNSVLLTDHRLEQTSLGRIIK